MAEFREIPDVFECEGDRLISFLHVGSLNSTRGLLIVVGGPQYRIGSHRQFVLIGRALASAGIPVMRFDYRGMGDSDGESRTFEDIGDDIRSAIDHFFTSVKKLEEVVIWGLCDAASAALLYAPKDPRVRGLVLVNPWVRTDDSLARARVGQYYSRRLFDSAFWSKLSAGEVSIAKSLFSFCKDAIASLNSRRLRAMDLPGRMAQAFEQYQGATLFILSGSDLIAREFTDAVGASTRWRRMMEQGDVSRLELPEANHTFSRASWRLEVTARTREWVMRL